MNKIIGNILGDKCSKNKKKAKIKIGDTVVFDRPYEDLAPSISALIYKVRFVTSTGIAKIVDEGGAGLKLQIPVEYLEAR